MLTTSAPDPSARPDERDSHAALTTNVQMDYVRREAHPRLMESWIPFDLTGLVDDDSDRAVQPAEGGNLNGVRGRMLVPRFPLKRLAARPRLHSLTREIP
jgi:hypothetical protein